MKTIITKTGNKFKAFQIPFIGTWVKTVWGWQKVRNWDVIKKIV